VDGPPPLQQQGQAASASQAESQNQTQEEEAMSKKMKQMKGPKHHGFGHGAHGLGKQPTHPGTAKVSRQDNYGEGNVSRQHLPTVGTRDEMAHESHHQANAEHGGAGGFHVQGGYEGGECCYKGHEGEKGGMGREEVSED
jgi:hypothetical protein